MCRGFPKSIECLLSIHTIHRAGTYKIHDMFEDSSNGRALDDSLSLLHCYEMSVLGIYLKFREIGKEPQSFFTPHKFNFRQAALVHKKLNLDEYFFAVKSSQFIAYGMLRGWSEGYETPSLGIYVFPKFRGVGLGLSTMKLIENRAIERGSKQIRLSVMKDNLNAIRLYSRLGYQFNNSSSSQSDKLIGLKDLAKNS